MNIKPPPPLFLPLNRDPALAIEQAIRVLKHIIVKHPEVRRDFDCEAFIHHELATALKALRPDGFGPGVKEAVAQGDFASAYGRQIDHEAALAQPEALSALDTVRLDWLQSQLKFGWGNGFAMQPLDSGAMYVRPWRKELEAQFAPDLVTKAFLWQPDIRTAIDEAMLAKSPPLAREPK